MDDDEPRLVYVLCNHHGTANSRTAIRRIARLTSVPPGPWIVDVFAPSTGQSGALRLSCPECALDVELDEATLCRIVGDFDRVEAVPVLLPALAAAVTELDEKFSRRRVTPN